MNISHQGIGTGNGLPFSLAAALKVAPGQQANFTGFNLLAARTAVKGEVDLCSAATKAVGVFVDCSPKGDSCTVETEGFEWVKYSGSAPAAGDFVTVAAGGKVALIAAGAGLDKVPTDAERHHGCWQVDEVNTTTGMVLINICC